MQRLKEIAEAQTSYTIKKEVNNIELDNQVTLNSKEMNSVPQYVQHLPFCKKELQVTPEENYCRICETSFQSLDACSLHIKTNHADAFADRNSKVYAEKGSFINIYDQEHNTKIESKIKIEAEDLPGETNIIHVASEDTNCALIKSDDLQPKVEIKIETTEVHNNSNEGVPTHKAIKTEENSIEHDENIIITNEVDPPSPKYEVFLSDPIFPENIEKDTKSNLFACTICGFKFVYKYRLHRHMETHLGIKRFSCDVCDYKSNEKKNLRRHIKIHSREKPYSCTICDFRCTNKRNLTSHINTHTKPFACHFCDYRSECRYTLKLHLQKHSGEKPYECDHCDYKCKLKTHLRVHIRTHTGEKPFACKICDYKCGNKTNLTKHIKTHNAIKQFACHICEYKSNVKRGLTKHMKRHTYVQGSKQFACDVCEYKSCDKHNFSRHIRIHNIYKLYACHICEYKSNVKRNLTLHMRKHKPA